MSEKLTEPEIAVTSGALMGEEAAPDSAITHLKHLKEQHHWDPNLPDDVIDEIDDALHHTAGNDVVATANDLMSDSPYPEVRAAVPNYDEGGHTNTIRAWVIGLVFATLGSGLNMLFSLRQPWISLPSFVAQVAAYPVGVFWAAVMPNREFQLFGVKWNLNPGPFSKKEHTLIVIMANATFAGGAAYATDVLVAQRAFYKQNFGWAFELLMCISSQMLGFGLAGFFHHFLVTPAAMIWPSTLINCAMFSALHDRTKPDPTKVAGWTIGKYRVFLFCMIGSFVWYWFPGYIAPFLSVFAFVTWIKPQNVIINQLFGGTTGMSLIPITFDWTRISGFYVSPLMTPWFGIANTMIGMFLFFWIVAPAIHFSGGWYAKFLPFSDPNSYDNRGMEYNVTRILNADFEFDEHKYKSYSPLFLSTTFALCYGLSFASVIAVLVHVVLFHGKEVWARFRKFGNEEEDVHGHLMSRFNPVPMWWYTAVTLVMTGMSLGVVLGWPTHLSWWAFFLSLIISIVWFIPIGIVAASSNVQIGLNVITEFLVGYLQPGKPMAMMLFKTYGYITMNQGLSFCSDMKIGHYMKLPPRVTFAAQMVSCLWSSIVQICVMNWALGSIPHICEKNQPSSFSCPNGRVFFNSSIIWGVIGPSRMFSGIYSPLLYFYIIGLVLPVLIYIGARMFPRSPIRYLNAPIIFGGTGSIPPATPLNYLSWGIVGFVFNKFIRDRWRGWWMQYNYVLSASLDVGLMLCNIFMFLALTLPGINFPSWWGTRIAANTMDAMGTAIQQPLANGQTFGPSEW
ncbi:hypothetical protein ASPZODRAFT_152280 [Penicilliopsis zonata CBS 506.65]|uniref:OPT family small oligopeptide transporter n=1 Tax=Penicilliopsis zonata CBS 506.65 TaxID=1073090 RepID=A0A1L9SFV4_9EURO|nr:hypothetical protein ASPZODRAFT_152280 [Penicilliopsis zonata CBS 506.65]OJJ46046.1 hypothetical protein ASPZODRAFT_152280 [Penicilliopsis zonata CBS 506.65]